MGKTVTKKRQNILSNGLEVIHDYGTNVVTSGAKIASDEFDNVFSDLLGLNQSSESSQNKIPQSSEVELWSRKQAEKAPLQEARGHIDYHGEIMKSSERAFRFETRELDKQIQEIIAELRKLIGSSKVLQMEFATITVQEAPVEVGEYHLNFFEWMLLTIRQAREKVEDSGAWLAAVKGKSGKKGGGYWDMFKKHGTSFGLSNERSAATSTG